MLLSAWVAVEEASPIMLIPIESHLWPVHADASAAEESTFVLPLSLANASSPFGG